MIEQVLAIVLAYGLVQAYKWLRGHELNFYHLVLGPIERVHPVLLGVLTAGFSIFALTHAAAAERVSAYGQSASLFAALAFITFFLTFLSLSRREAQREKPFLLRQQKRPPMARLQKSRW